MGILKPSDPWEREFKEVWRQEQWYLRRYEEKPASRLTQKVSDLAPEGLTEALQRAFVKAFQVVFEKGSPLIARVGRQAYRRETYQKKAAAVEETGDRASLRALSRSARRAGWGSAVLSGAAGTGMGLFGVALPDVPLLTGMLLKCVYEAAESYGFPCDDEAERMYALRLMETALSSGGLLREGDRALNRYAQQGDWMEERSLEDQVRRTACRLAETVLYEKALQSVPVVGAAGGAQDGVCIHRVRKYAGIMYHKRFLMARRTGE